MQRARLADFAEVKHLQEKKALFQCAQGAKDTGTVGYGLREENDLSGGQSVCSICFSYERTESTSS